MGGPALDKRAASAAFRVVGPPLLAVTAAVTTGCKVQHPQDHSTPLRSVLSFQDAFAHDRLEQEYGALSQTLRRREGVTLQTYALARPHLLEPLGGIGSFVLRRNSLEDNVRAAWIEGDRSVLAFSLFRREFRIALSREARLHGSGRGGQAGFEAALRAGDWSLSDDLLEIRFELPSDTAHRLLRDGVERVELRPTWKVDAFGEGGLDGDESEYDPSVAHEAPPPPIEHEVESIPIRVVGEDLGHTELAIGLALTPWLRGALDEDHGLVERSIVWRCTRRSNRP